MPALGALHRSVVAMSVRSVDDVRASWARLVGTASKPEKAEEASSTLAALARRGARVAGHLEDHGYRYAGIVRQLAQAVAESAGWRDPDACPVCGDPIVQPQLGRRREVCSQRCRATKWRRNGKVRRSTKGPSR
jgi:hypothetical protein